jgi:hypothetical protein
MYFIRDRSLNRALTGIREASVATIGLIVIDIWAYPDRMTRRNEHLTIPSKKSSTGTARANVDAEENRS